MIIIKELEEILKDWPNEEEWIETDWSRFDSRIEINQPLDKIKGE